MQCLRGVFVAAAVVLAVGAGEEDAEQGSCDFVNEPVFPGYFWDPSCKMGKLGCNADGKHVECRFCGGGVYTTPCPPSSCHYPGGEPAVPYYWDNDCAMGQLGCWADGVHRQCRYCGDAPFTSVECPPDLIMQPRGAKCVFETEPEAPYFWDPSCKNGTLGCYADGQHEQCRFCGVGDYATIQCPASEVCSFEVEPTSPYYWEPNCAVGMLGCNADGIHAQCRFCAMRPFEDIPCPNTPGNEEIPKKEECDFAAPPVDVEYYWEPACEMGLIGCWADGLNANCRFCGSGVYQNISCSGMPSPVVEPQAVDQSGEATGDLLAARSAGLVDAAKDFINQNDRDHTLAGRESPEHDDEHQLSGAFSAFGVGRVALVGAVVSSAWLGNVA